MDSNKYLIKHPLTIYTAAIYASPIVGIGSVFAFNKLGGLFENDTIRHTLNYIGLGILLLCFVFYHVMWFVNFAFGIKNAASAPGKGKITGKGCFVCKLVQIPYHCLFFAACAIWVMGAANPFLFWSYIFLPLAVFHSFCVMLSTSVYGITRAIRLKKDRAITTGKTVAVIILLLIFVLDFIGAAMLFTADKARSEAAGCTL